MFTKTIGRAVSTIYQFRLKFSVVQLFQFSYTDWSTSLRSFRVSGRTWQMIFVQFSLDYFFAMLGILFKLTSAGWNKLPSGQNQCLVLFANNFATKSVFDLCKETGEKLMN